MKNKNEKVNKDKPQEIYFREDFFSQKEGFFFFFISGLIHITQLI